MSPHGKIALLGFGGLLLCAWVTGVSAGRGRMPMCRTILRAMEGEARGEEPAVAAAGVAWRSLRNHAQAALARVY